MNSNNALRLIRNVSLAAILSLMAVVMFAGCSFVIQEPAPPERVPLQSLEEYERDESIKAVQQVDTGDDPLLQNLADLALAELAGASPELVEDAIVLEEPSLVIPEGSLEAPGAAFLMETPELPENCLLLTEPSLALPAGPLEIPESIYLLPERSFVLPESCLGFPEGSLEAPTDIPLPAGIVVLPEGSAVVAESSLGLGEGAIEAPIPRQATQISFSDRVVEASRTASWPAVGAILAEAEPGSGSFRTWCTTTLIGCDTVLTASHCVMGKKREQLKVFFQNAGIINVAEIHPHQQFARPNADVAVLKLEHAVDGIRPEPINYTGTVDANISGTIVGFGRTSGTRSDYGIKRYGSITTVSCTDGLSDDNLICWDFTARGGTTGQASNSCDGDSGGPFFYPETGQRQVSGIIAGGTDTTCVTADQAYNSRVSHYSDWIKNNSGSLGGESCGRLPFVTGDMVEVGYGVLGITGTQKIHFFQVQPGTQLLRITMNGEDPGPNMTNFNLYVRAGAEPDLATSTYDCASKNSWQYEVCEIANPTPGTWYALVYLRTATSGTGEYQVVATTYGANP